MDDFLPNKAKCMREAVSPNQAAELVNAVTFIPVRRVKTHSKSRDEDRITNNTENAETAQAEVSIAVRLFATKECC